MISGSQRLWKKAGHAITVSRAEDIATGQNVILEAPEAKCDRNV